MIFSLICLLTPVAFSQITSIQCNVVANDNGAPGRRAIYDNRTQGCNLWTLEWSFKASIPPTVELDGANDAGAVPGAWGAAFFYPSSLNANPIGLVVGILVLHGYAPWISINVGNGGTNVTSFNYLLRGFYSQSPESFITAMGTNNAGIPVQQCNAVHNISVTAATTAVVVPANVNFLFSHICGFSLTGAGAATGASIGTATTGNCAAGITTTFGSWVLAAGASVAMGSNLGAMFGISNSFDLCVAAVTNQVNGMIYYNQNNIQQ